MKILPILKNIFSAIIKGRLMLRLHLDRHFIKMLVCMFLCIMTIWISLLIDNTMTTVKRNNDILKEQQIDLAIKTFELSELSRRSTIEDNLERLGSKARKPEKPAKQLR